MERSEKTKPIDYARSETLEDLSKIELYLEANPRNPEVSEFPLVSFGYRSCNAISLSNGRKVGLCHIDGNDISYNLDKMVKDFGVPLNELKAIPVAGSGMKKMKESCKDFGIDVVNWYQDDYHVDDSGEMIFYPRDVLVIPSLKEVIIYTQKGRVYKLFDSYFELTPEFMLFNKTINRAHTEKI